MKIVVHSDDVKAMHKATGLSLVECKKRLGWKQLGEALILVDDYIRERNLEEALRLQNAVIRWFVSESNPFKIDEERQVS